MQELKGKTMIDNVMIRKAKNGFVIHPDWPNARHAETPLSDTMVFESIDSMVEYLRESFRKEDNE